MGKQSFKKTYIIILILFILSVLLLSEITGVFRSNTSVVLDIPSGTTVSGFAEILKDNGLINSEILFKIYAKSQNGMIKKGSHEFSDKSYSGLYSEGCNSAKEGINITITEGMEFYQIARLLEQNGLGTYKEFINVAKINNFDYWFLSKLPNRKYELEGYLFPDTYNFSNDQTPYDIINIMLANFNSKFTEKMKNRAEELNMSVDEIITLASVVEREVADKTELDVVAGIFYNRINKKGEATGKLESCATVQYILEERKEVLSVADTKIDSLYNTYIYAGLPQGPIAQPGMTAINAVLYPQNTDYLYFVSDGTGKHIFSETYDEHMKNMRKVGL